MAGLRIMITRILIRRFSTALLLLALCLCTAPTDGADKTYFAEHYRTEITIAGSGDLHVRETVRIRFEGGEFTYFFRGIPTDRTDGIEFISASESPQLKQRRRLLEVMWRFEPIRDTTRTFVLEYQALGAAEIRDGRSVLRWNLFPYDRPYRIDHADALLMRGPRVPAPVEIATEPSAAPIQPVDEGFLIGPRRLPPETTLRVRADWADLLPAASTASWQLAEKARGARTPYILAVAGAIFLGGLAMLVQMWRRMKARLSPGASASLGGKPPIIPQPPEKLPAALSGSLVHGNAWTSQIVAILFDLGRAGSVRFAKESKGPKKKGKPPDLVRLGVPPAEEWESVLLDSIFGQAGAGESIKWSKAQKRLLKSQPVCRKALLGELERRGDLDPAGREARRLLATCGVILLLAGLVLVLLNILLIGWAGAAGFAIPAALLLPAAAFGIASQAFPLWTAVGRDRARQWKGFGEYLKQAAGGKTPLDEDRYVAWLPYAVTFGCAKKWTRAANRWGIQAPVWLPRLEDGSWDTAATLAVVTSTVTAGGSAAAGGAGGAGGGGSSGAG